MLRSSSFARPPCAGRLLCAVAVVPAATPRGRRQYQRGPPEAAHGFGETGQCGHASDEASRPRCLWATVCPRRRKGDDARKPRPRRGRRNEESRCTRDQESWTLARRRAGDRDTSAGTGSSGAQRAPHAAARDDAGTRRRGAADCIDLTRERLDTRCIAQRRTNAQHRERSLRRRKCQPPASARVAVRRERGERRRGARTESRRDTGPPEENNHACRPALARWARRRKETVNQKDRKREKNSALVVAVPARAGAKDTTTDGDGGDERAVKRSFKRTRATVARAALGVGNRCLPARAQRENGTRA
ncbi:hypothetical protein ERJ75_000795400 [Trypanosoma vivax]|nr:hypothetical protein ERJ75_000795400 [Trypanosoma vivax]